jgi:hypothetical protein
VKQDLFAEILRKSKNDMEGKCINIINNAKLPLNLVKKKLNNMLSVYKSVFVTFYGDKNLNKKFSYSSTDLQKDNINLSNKYNYVQAFSFVKGPFNIEKPIFKDKPVSIVPVTQQIVNKQTTDTILRPNPVTKFSVSWREDTPSGEVNQNTHYFSNYDEWKEFVNQYPNTVSQNENGSKTEAQALYSGLHADISKDKTVKGPR